MKTTKKSIISAISKEMQRLSVAWVSYAYLKLPLNFLQALLKDPAFGSILDKEKFKDAFSDATLQLFDQLGPLYGKAGQMALSRMNPTWHKRAEGLRLTRLYDEWPALNRHDVEAILDDQI
jgi:predicted unusual protein kinase regulating ubiquinone biosynthesis (AarF/ABC1/UbiB family)